MNIRAINATRFTGLEEALEGKTEGEKLSVDIKSDLAYGPRVDALEQQVPASAFGDIKDIEMGMRFQAETEQGPVMVVVTQIEGETITVDGNHPLAGQDLHFGGHFFQLILIFAFKF